MANIIFEYIFFADPHFFYLIKINDNIFDEITKIMYSSIYYSILQSLLKLTYFYVKFIVSSNQQIVENKQPRKKNHSYNSQRYILSTHKCNHSYFLYTFSLIFTVVTFLLSPFFCHPWKSLPYSQNQSQVHPHLMGVMRYT